MVSAINHELIPLGVTLPQTDRDIVGGYFIWITLPDPLQGAVVAQRAQEEENVIVAQVWKTSEGKVRAALTGPCRATFSKCLGIQSTQERILRMI